jgi:hypothetical protein
MTNQEKFKRQQQQYNVCVACDHAFFDLDVGIATCSKHNIRLEIYEGFMLSKKDGVSIMCENKVLIKGE